MKSTFDKILCMEQLRGIWENDRYGDFSHYEKTSKVVAKYLSDAGLCEVERLSLKADGKTEYGNWVMPRAWDMKKAYLRYVDGEIICDSETTPLCVGMFSSGIEERELDVIWAEKNDPSMWRGKLLYTSEAPTYLVQKAFTFGAIGIISDWRHVYEGVREADDMLEDACCWENDLFYPENKTGLIAFSISKAQGIKLQNRLLEEKIIPVIAFVDAHHYNGVNYVVSGLIPPVGTDREIMFCGHLYEPGANDNASGCAMLCSVAKVLNESLTGNHLGIRFVMGYEAAGMSGYAAEYPERLKRIVCALNCDMVGAANEEKALMKLWNSTWTMPDFSYPFLKMAAKEIGIPFESMPFDIGDCLIADPSIGVPCSSLVMHPSRSYHSSLDTPEKVDINTLEKSALLAMKWAETMASPTEATINAVKDVLKKEYQAITMNADSTDYLLRMESYEKELEAFEAWAYPDVVPVRKFSGPATLGGKMRAVRRDLDPFYNNELNTALFHTDGKRTLQTIIRRTCTELHIPQDEQIEKRLRDFFDAMNDAGLIDYERS